MKFTGICGEVSQKTECVIKFKGQICNFKVFTLNAIEITNNRIFGGIWNEDKTLC